MKTKRRYKMVLKRLQLLIIFLVIGAISNVTHADIHFAIEWENAYTITGQSTSAAPALAVFNNNLYCIYKENAPSNRMYVTSTGDGKNWSSAYIIPGQSTTASPALAVFKNNLYCVYKENAPSNRMGVISTGDGKNWSSAYIIQGLYTLAAAPALAVYKNNLYCIYKANAPSNIMVVTSTGDGKNWSRAYNNYIWGQSTSAAPALALFHNLYCVYKANDQSNIIYVTWTGDGKNWITGYFGNIYNIPGQSTTASPALAVFNNNLYCVYKANDPSNAIFVSRTKPQFFVQLNVPLYAQQTNSWCWAAGAEMIMTYLGKNVAQCTQANNRFGRSDCCDYSYNCAFGGWPEYWRYGFTYSSSWYSALSFEKLQEQFYKDKPVGFAWGWTGGGGHYMVARGFTDLTTQGLSPFYRLVVVNDPWPCFPWYPIYSSGGTPKIFVYSEYVAAPDHYTMRNDYNITKK